MIPAVRYFQNFILIFLILLLSGCETVKPVLDKAVFWKDLEEVEDKEEVVTEEERKEMRRIEMVRRGKTLLMQAVEDNDFEMVSRLVTAGEHINVSDNSGQTALHIAIRDCKINISYFLMDNGASIYARDVGGRTMMHMAALSDCERLIRATNSRGLEVDNRDKFGRTALMLAAENYHADAVDALLYAGANVSSRDNRGKSALYLAAEQIGFYEEPPEPEEVVELPRVRRSDSWPPYLRKPVQYMADLGTETWDAVISYDYSQLNPFRKDELPPDNIRTFTMLLDAGASLDDMDYSFKTVYDIIILRGDPEIIELIEEYRQ